MSSRSSIDAETGLRQPCDRPRGEVLVREIDQGIATPEGVGLGEELDGSFERTGGGQRAALGRELLEPPDVDGLGWELQGIPVAAHDDEVG